MTFWILLVIALTLSLLSLRWRNILFSLGAAIGWLVLWRYNLNYPPTNITQGDITHDWMNYVFIIMAIAVMLIWFRNRNRGYTGYSRTAIEERDYQREVRSPVSQSSEGDYRQTVNKALHHRRRR